LTSYTASGCLTIYTAAAIFGCLLVHKNQLINTTNLAHAKIPMLVSHCSQKRNRLENVAMDGRLQKRQTTIKHARMARSETSKSLSGMLGSVIDEHYTWKQDHETGKLSMINHSPLTVVFRYCQKRLASANEGFEACVMQRCGNCLASMLDRKVRGPRDTDELVLEVEETLLEWSNKIGISIIDVMEDRKSIGNAYNCINEQLSVLGLQKSDIKKTWVTGGRIAFHTWHMTETKWQKAVRVRCENSLIPASPACNLVEEVHTSAFTEVIPSNPLRMFAGVCAKVDYLATPLKLVWVHRRTSSLS